MREKKVVLFISKNKIKNKIFVYMVQVSRRVISCSNKWSLRICLNFE